MGTPNFFVPVALSAFLVAVAVAFWIYSPRRAALSTLVGGWMFLPHYDGRYRFLAMYGKEMFVAGAVLAASLYFDFRSWQRLRPRLLDVPVGLFCVLPFITALDNGLGVKEAGSATWEAFFTWGAPYLLGRVYFGSLQGVSELARGLAAGSLVYAPFCLWEARMSPQLHRMLYGFQSWSFDQSLRMGGYRPAVFMQHGLALGMFMTAGTLCAYWLWRTRAARTILGMPLAWVTPVLFVTTFLTRSTGAIVLLFVGVAVLEATRRTWLSWTLVVLALAPPVYCAARIGGWNPPASSRW